MSGGAAPGRFGICSWEIHHACNYRCPYCPLVPFWRDAPEAADRRHLRPSAREWLDFWERIHERYGEFRIEISGGEPFEYPDFPALVRELTRRHEAYIITNLSGAAAEGAENLDPDRVSFLASFHPHSVGLDVFLAKAAALRDRGFSIQAIVVAYPPLLPRLPELRAAFKSKELVLFVAPFNGEHQDRRYPEQYGAEEKERIWPESGRERELWEFSLEGRSPYGGECAAGMRYFRAQPDGRIYRCIPCRDMQNSRPMGVIGDPEFRLAAAPALCPARYCRCPVEQRNLLPAAG